MLAERQGKLDELERAMAKGEETFVELPREIPVRLLYHTAYVGPGGRVLFRPDPYGWDEDLAATLGLEVRERPGAPVHINLPGPSLLFRLRNNGAPSQFDRLSVPPQPHRRRTGRF